MSCVCCESENCKCDTANLVATQAMCVQLMLENNELRKTLRRAVTTAERGDVLLQRAEKARSEPKAKEREPDGTAKPLTEFQADVHNYAFQPNEPRTCVKGHRYVAQKREDECPHCPDSTVALSQNGERIFVGDFVTCTSDSAIYANRVFRVIEVGQGVFAASNITITPMDGVGDARRRVHSSFFTKVTRAELDKGPPVKLKDAGAPASDAVEFRVDGLRSLPNDKAKAVEQSALGVASVCFGFSKDSNPFINGAEDIWIRNVPSNALTADMHMRFCLVEGKIKIAVVQLQTTTHGAPYSWAVASAVEEERDQQRKRADAAEKEIARIRNVVNSIGYADITKLDLIKDFLNSTTIGSK